VIIIYHSWNDLKYISRILHQSDFGVMDLSGNDAALSFKVKLLNYSYTYTMSTAIGRILSDRLRSPQVDYLAFESTVKNEVVEDFSYGYSVFERNLISTIAVAKKNNIAVILAHPLTLLRANDLKKVEKKIISGYVGVSTNELREMMDQLTVIMKRVAKDEEVRYIDLNTVIPISFEVLMDHIHPTLRGNELIAEALYEEIEPLLRKL